MKRPHPARRRGATGLPSSFEVLEPRALLSIALVKDINSQVQTPSNITAFGDRTAFVLRDQYGEFAALTTDGTAAGTTKISAGTYTLPENYQVNVAAAGGTLYYDMATFPSLIETDGAPTTKITFVDLPTDTGLKYPQDLTPVGDELYFVSADTYGIGLYVTDGTSTGSYLVADFSASAGSATTFDLTDVDGTVYFAADDGVHGEQLWRSDGTTAGTTMVTDFAAGLNPSDLTASGGSLYFLAAPTPGGTTGAVYRSDGTASGTISAPSTEADGPLSAFDGSVAFDGTTASGTGLVLSNGTAAGTGLIRADYLAGASFNDITASGSTLYFTTEEATGTTRLGKTDGTTTTLISPIQRAPIDPPDGPPQPPVADGSGGIFFDAYDPSHGVELWHSDGTAAGTGIVADIDPGPAGSDPADLTESNGSLYFAAQDGDGTSQLWRSDGTAAGTVLVDSVSPGSTLGSVPSPTATSGPTTATIGPESYFVADDPDSGAELWKSDGTTAGTALVADLVPGPVGSDPSDLTTFGGLLDFVADDGTLGRQVWQTDGTAAGTAVVSDVPSSIATTSGPTDLVVFDGLLYFSDQGDAAGTGSGLYKTDGTMDGTVLVASTSAAPGGLTVVGADLDFFVSDSSAGEVLWSSDGTTAGTAPVGVIDANPGESTILEPTAVDSLLYFVVQTPAYANALWVSDGTAGGARFVASFNPGMATAAPHDLTAFDSKLFFSAIGTPNQYIDQLWSSDGTAAGTTIFDPNGYGDAIDYGGELYYLGIYFAGEGNIYKSDGTTAGTAVLGTIDATGPLTIVDGSLDFEGYQDTPTTNNPSRGIFQSDGTVSGTVMVGIDDRSSYFTPTGGSITPLLPLPGGSVLVIFDDLFTGAEPYVVSNDPPQFFSDPTPQTAILGKTLTYSAMTTDPDAGQTLTYSLDPGAPAGASINSQTGLISYTPTADQLGTQTLTVRVTDDAATPASVAETITVYVTFGVPVLAPIANQSVAPGQTVTVRASATEFDPGATTIYSLNAQDFPPGLATIDPATGLITITPTVAMSRAGYTVALTATDSLTPGVSTTENFVIFVRPPTQGDFNGDGSADLGIYDETAAAFYVRATGTGNVGFDEGLPIYTGDPSHVNIPIAADFDGDGEADLAVYDQTAAAFYVRLSSTDDELVDGGAPIYMGNPAHVNVPVVGDFDGDGKADLAIYDETADAFYVRLSSTGYTTALNGGQPITMGDPSHHNVPVAGDFDGDGRTDLAIYDETADAFYVRFSGSDYTTAMNGGQPVYMGNPAQQNVPVAGDFDGDGRTDLAIYDETGAAFYVRYSSMNYLTALNGGDPTYMGDPSHLNIPIAADFDGDGKTDLAIYDETGAAFYIRYSSTDYLTALNGGAPTYMGNPAQVNLPLGGTAVPAAGTPSRGRAASRSFSAISPPESALDASPSGSSVAPADAAVAIAPTAEDVDAALASWPFPEARIRHRAAFAGSPA